MLGAGASGAGVGGGATGKHWENCAFF